MGTRDWKQPTKVQAVFMGLVAVLLFANNLNGVLAEGVKATVWYWVLQALDLALLAFSFWWYHRAAKNPPAQS
jgi:sterol desaturase/sphingolipid hydroxylase (fatty acid hydroxylase superfamily)